MQVTRSNCFGWRKRKTILHKMKTNKQQCCNSPDKAFFFSLLTYSTNAKILKTMKKIQFKLSRYTVYLSEEQCALIGLYGDSPHKFSFSTFLTKYFYKIRKHPQTIHVSISSLANVFWKKKKKHYLIKIYDSLYSGTFLVRNNYQ